MGARTGVVGGLVLLFASAELVWAAPAAPELGGSKWRPVSEWAWPAGRGEAELGLRADGEESPAEGPAALVYLGDELVVVDGVNRRLLRIRPDGRRRWVPWARAKSTRALVALGSALAGYDALGDRVVVLEDDAEVAEVEAPRDGLLRLEGTDDGALVLRGRAGGARRRLLADGPPDAKSRRRRFGVEGRFVGRGLVHHWGQRALEVRRSGDQFRLVALDPVDEVRVLSEVTLLAPKSGRILAASLIGSDRSGRSFVRLELETAKDPLRVHRLIRIYDPRFQLEDELTLPTGPWAPNQDVAVHPQGELAILLPGADRTHLVRLRPR